MLLTVPLGTEEGLDKLMSLIYYARMRFVLNLMPLLLSSSLPAHIISVYAAGFEDTIDTNDLSLREPGHYSYLKARSHIVYMKTCMMEALAEQHRGKLSFVHVFPGLVITKGFEDPELPTWIKIAWRFLGPIGKLFAIGPEECGDRILFLATDRYPAKGDAKSDKTLEGTDVAEATNGTRGGGAYSVTSNGDVVPLEKKYAKIQKEELSKQAWDHTMKVFDQIKTGKVFSG